MQERQQRLELLEAWEQINQGDLHSQPLSKAQEAAEVAQQDQQEGLIQALATSMFPDFPGYTSILLLAVLSRSCSKDFHSLC